MRILTVAAVVIALVFAGLFLNACSPAKEFVAPVDTVEVLVPVIAGRTAPAELVNDKIPQGDLPVFVSPLTPGATSCLAPSGETQLKAIMRNRESRLDAWQKWGIME